MIDMRPYTFLFVVLPQVPYLFHQHALLFTNHQRAHGAPKNPTWGLQTRQTLGTRSGGMHCLLPSAGLAKAPGRTAWLKKDEQI